jgi:hypothetical protein
VKVRIKIGKGISGAIRYVMGPGHDPKTGHFLPADSPSRVAWIGGTGFSYEIESNSDIDLARREMEFDALHQASKTKKCVYDCVHTVLAWERGETPTREEMEDAARSHLKAQGMGNAKAIWAAHNDEDYFHLHIVASKINPATGYAYNLAGSWRKASVWAENYEREHGGIVHVNRESANELRRAIRERDVEGVLAAMTKRNAHFGAEQLQRVVGKEIHPEIGASDGKKRSVELERAQFVNAILSHQSVRRLAEKLELPEPWMSAAGGLAGLSDDQREAAQRSYDSWSARKPELGEKHDLADYVQYVQDKWAKEEHPREAVGLRYTTRSVLDAEAYVLNAAAGLKTDTGHDVGEDRRFAILKASKYEGISREQALAFRHCTGDEGLAIIDGQAGTGKSFTMAAIRDAYEAEGHRVIGLAFTNKVVKNLARDGFRHTNTVHKELTNLYNNLTSWDRKTVVCVDETTMLDTKLMAYVTTHARDAGAKLILVGDDRQLSSVDAGGMFTELKKRHGAAVLSEVRRQYKADEARASEMMHEGNFDAALAIYEKKGAIHWTRTQVEARAGLVEKWAADTAANREQSHFVFAYTNQDVDLLNVALHGVRKERGELEWKDHSIKTAHGRFDFSAGDRVQFTDTDNRRGIVNGTVGTILAIDGTHLAVRLAGPEGQTINFDAASFDHFRHGYAGTVWKGQGDTLDCTYLYHSEHWRSAPSYVALTRHREATSLFVATNTAEDLKALAKQMARQDDRRAASAFYQLDPIEPVRPLHAREILEQFAGEQFRRTAERMEREGRAWPAPRPVPATPQDTPVYRQDNQPPAGLESAPEPGTSTRTQADASDAPQQRPASNGHSRWGDNETQSSGIGHKVRRRWQWRGVAGLIVSGEDHHPNRPGTIRRRRKRGHGR